jgi:hypothetical protein
LTSIDLERAILSGFHIMPGHVLRLESGAAFDPVEAERSARTHRLAASVLAEMQERGIVPTPGITTSGSPTARTRTPR